MGDRTWVKVSRRGGGESSALRARLVWCGEGRDVWVSFHPAAPRLWLVMTELRSGRHVATTSVPLEAWSMAFTSKRSDFMASWIRKVEVRERGGAGSPAAHDEDLGASCPALHDYLTATVGPGGVSRKPSSLTVFAEDGVFKGVLSERDEGLSLWASSDTVAGLLGALDGLLQAVTVPWRKAGGGQGGKRK